jgi:hypothetical protein
MSDQYDGPLMAQQILRLQAAQHGMTLRDWFAGQAMRMIPYPSHLGLQQYQQEHFAEYTERMTAAAYQIADAMLKAREVKP